MFPRVYNLQGNATMYMLVTLQQFTLSKSLSNYIPMPIAYYGNHKQQLVLHEIIKKIIHIFKLSDASTEVSLENVIIYQCFA